MSPEEALAIRHLQVDYARGAGGFSVATDAEAFTADGGTLHPANG
jgi:hypothetical protein